MRNTIITILISCICLIPAACGEDSQSPDSTQPTDTDTTDTGGDSSDGDSTSSEVPTGPEILEALGAKGAEGADPTAVDAYRSTFRRMDTNGDDIVTLEEYIASGHFGEEQATAIFEATDRDQNGEMTEEEYVENRIITDEAKLIFEDLDSNQDSTLLEAEFVENAPFEPDVAAAVYGLFDSDGSGDVMVPEFLRVWGAWARGEEAP